jgi:hypothetical protein
MKLLQTITYAAQGRHRPVSLNILPETTVETSIKQGMEYRVLRTCPIPATATPTMLNGRLIEIVYFLKFNFDVSGCGNDQTFTMPITIGSMS